MDVSDSEYVVKCQGGDREAFGMLYDRYAEKIYRFVYFKVLNKDVAEDLTSAVFVKAYEKIGSFNGEKGNFSQWVYSIARNTVIDHYRTSRKNVDIEDIYDLGEDERTEEKIDARNLLQKVEKYLTKLSPRQREIVTLRVWEEMSYREIAEVIGGSEDSIKVMFSRTIRELLTKLGPKAVVALALLGTGYLVGPLSY